jgi:hypothetical protein
MMMAVAIILWVGGPNKPSLPPPKKKEKNARLFFEWYDIALCIASVVGLYTAIKACAPIVD